MIVAWCAHLKFTGATLSDRDCKLVPANRYGHAVYSAAALKTIEEVTRFAIFAVFSIYPSDQLTINHAIGFALICLGAFFIFKGPLG